MARVQIPVRALLSRTNSSATGIVRGFEACESWFETPVTFRHHERALLSRTTASERSEDDRLAVGSKPGPYSSTVSKLESSIDILPALNSRCRT